MTSTDASPIGDLLQQRPRTGVKIHAYSIDEDDPRIGIFMGGGFKRRDKRWRLLKAARELVRQCRGQKEPELQFSPAAADILEYLADHAMHWGTGRCFPSIERIAAQIRKSRSHTITCLKQLRRAGFIEWVRRSRLTPEGRKQASNAYQLRLPRRLARLFGDAGKAAHAILKALLAEHGFAPDRHGLPTASYIAELKRVAPAGRSLARALARLGVSLSAAPS